MSLPRAEVTASASACARASASAATGTAANTPAPAPLRDPELLGGSRTRVMGILNVTPDSFSDGGRWDKIDTAIAHGHELIAAGADIIDIGGESTRPGATLLSAAEEWERIGPVVRELAAHIPISVDTYHAHTAARACAAGARIINDVTGGRGDSAMWTTVAESGAYYVLQHGRGDAQTMNSLAGYRAIGREVSTEVLERVAGAVAAGIAPTRIIIDPGFGFAKMGDDDWRLAAHIDEFLWAGMPVLIGVSRKRFLAEVTPEGLPASGRDGATAALSTYFAEKGVWAVRVHDVASSRIAVDTVAKLRSCGLVSTSQPGVARPEVAGSEAVGIAEAVRS